MSSVDHDAGSPAARVSETNSPRPAVITVTLHIVATAAAGLILASAVMALEWLGGRSWAIVGLGALALVAVWWPRGRHTGAVWSACGGLAVATRLERVARGDPMQRPKWLPPGDYEYVAGMSDRILSRDLPAVGAYAIVIAAAILMVICVILALPWRGRVTVIGRRARVLGTLGGALAAALMVVSTIAAASAVRTVADRRADTAAVTATVSRPAERLNQTGGPSRPAKIAWTFEPPRSDEFAEGFIGVAAVPGWDALIAAIRHYPVTDEGPDLRNATTRIVALSKTDGSQLWQYWRHDGAVQGAAVDPDAGRVLLFADQTTVTLDLSDGSQLAASVPDPWRAVSGNLVDSRFMEEGFHRGAVVTLGPTAVSWNYHGDESLTVFDVAGGEVLATTDPHAGCSYAAATTASPVIVEWGCGAPQVLSLAGPELVRTPITGSDDQAGFLSSWSATTARRKTWS